MLDRVRREHALFQHMLGRYSLDCAFPGAYVEGRGDLGHTPASFL